MFVVIVCTHCQGASQIDEAELGSVVQCPLCHQATAARTAEAILPVAKPLQPVIYSLDDAAPAPPRVDGKDIEPRPRPKGTGRTVLYAVLSAFLTFLVMAAVYGAFRYGSGDLPSSAWETYSPPGGNCTISLPGRPVEEEVPPDGPGILGGKRFVVHRWFEKVEVAFGWFDLDADRFIDRRFDDLLVGLRDREAKRLGGVLQEQGRVSFDLQNRPFEVRRFVVQLPRGKAVLQYYFDADLSRLKHHEQTLTEEHTLWFPALGPLGMTATPVLPMRLAVPFQKTVIDPGQRLRIYLGRAEGEKIGPETPWVSRFFNSFSPN